MNAERMEVVYLPAEQLEVLESNPNRQKDVVFNNLVENIQEIGMVEPIMVAPVKDENGEIVPERYKIVSGAHRYEACKMLDYEEIPCIVQHDFDEDMTNFQLVRMNMLKGELDPVKFTQLFNKMAEKYGEELTKTSMGLVDAGAFDKLYVQIKNELPPELREKLEAAKEDIKNVDDLSRILNEMFSTYGDTLKHNYMIFQYGGKSHLWVMMDSKLKSKLIDSLLDQIRVGDYDINAFFSTLITKYGDSVIGELTPMGTKVENLFEDGVPMEAEYDENDLTY